MLHHIFGTETQLGMSEHQPDGLSSKKKTQGRSHGQPGPEGTFPTWYF